MEKYEDKLTGCIATILILFICVAGIAFYVGMFLWLSPAIATIVFILLIWYVFIKASIEVDRADLAVDEMIVSYSFPDILTEKLIEKYPHISSQQANLVICHSAPTYLSKTYQKSF